MIVPLCEAANARMMFSQTVVPRRCKVSSEAKDQTLLDLFTVLLTQSYDDTIIEGS